MGDPKRIRKKYKTPRQPFEKSRITHDLQLVGKYGLRNMKAVWKHQTMLANFRGNARRLLSLEEEDRQVGERELLGRLNRLGLIKSNATLDNVLSLKIEDFMERRLQTMVYKSGMATTTHHARQMIVHGHIGIGEKISKSPSYLVKAAEEKIITYVGKSPFRKTSHKALPANVYKSKKPKEDKKRDDRGGRRPQRRPGRSGPPRPAPTAEKKVIDKAVERPVPTKEGTVPSEKVVLDEKVVDILPPKEKAEPKKVAPAKKVEPKKAEPAKKVEPKKAEPAKKVEPKKGDDKK
ncbi:MAG: 30S ribosomal protein S4 [Candidatus Heimdallarchaeota archaeon]